MSALQALDVGGSRDGCYVAVCSARSGCLRRGVVHKDGKCSAGHAGVGLGWQTGKLNFTHGPAAFDVVFINELEEISGINRGAGPCRHRPVSVNPANEAARGGCSAHGLTLDQEFPGVRPSHLHMEIAQIRC